MGGGGKKKKKEGTQNYEEYAEKADIRHRVFIVISDNLCFSILVFMK